MAFDFRILALLVFFDVVLTLALLRIAGVREGMPLSRALLAESPFWWVAARVLALWWLWAHAAVIAAQVGMWVFWSISAFLLVVIVWNLIQLAKV